MLYFVDMWSVRKESSREQGILLETVAQRRIQNELVSTATGNKFVNVVHERVAYRHAAYFFLLCSSF